MEASIKKVNRSKEAARASYNRMSRWYDRIAGRTEKKYRDWGLEKLSAQAGENIFEKFSSERMASTTLDVFRGLTEKSQRSESAKLPLDAFTSLA